MFYAWVAADLLAPPAAAGAVDLSYIWSQQCRRPIISAQQFFQLCLLLGRTSASMISSAGSAACI
eukprot:scaffold344680_cov15-Prasinocladus_malaysianus.AAC.1